MTYELAKQLKDAGFPQDGRHFYWSDHTSPETLWCINALELREPYVPSKHFTASLTLSELIEAIGATGHTLEMHQYSDKSGWMVSIDKHTWTSDKELDVAVARLWVVLNKK